MAPTHPSYWSDGGRFGAASGSVNPIWTAPIERTDTYGPGLSMVGQAAGSQPAAAWPIATPASFGGPFGLDSWLFLRADGGGAGAGAAPGSPAYGGSQVGAVLRYRLAMRSSASPELYARASHALGAAGGASDFALGLSARPFPGLPLRAHGEARLTRQAGMSEVRPSAFVTAGADAVELPARFSGRGYLQAGWVGGRFATLFADGLAVADRELADFDLGRARAGSVRAGVGVWGGAQKDAQRLDIGPSATVLLGARPGPVALSVDYRLRVAGDAVPESGAALTLSKAF